ncbi:MAG: right-handed parallel beta-helix repeat-containing protein [Nanoarchaeota archaeon]|nr:right-handed parallel beta-helix repeat-containing protein [Nanoarchaeota archaeon]
MGLALFSLYFYQLTSGAAHYNLLTGSFIGLAVDNDSLISVPTANENEDSSSSGMEIVLPPQEEIIDPLPEEGVDNSSSPTGAVIALPPQESPEHLPSEIPEALPETIPEDNETASSDDTPPLMTQEIVPLATTCNTNIAACQSTGWTNNTVYCLTAHLSNTKGSCFNFSVDHTSNITLDCRGFDIDGDDSAGTDYGVEADSTDINFTLVNCNISDFTTGMRVISSVNLSIENSSFFSNTDDGLNVGTTINLSVKRSDFADNGGNGLDTSLTGDNNGAVIYNNTFRGQNGTNNRGLYIYRGDDYWNITQNTFINNFFGIYDEGGTQNIGLSVYKNTFQNHNVSSSAVALAIENDYGAVFSENFFDHNNIGLHFVREDAHDNMFYDNQFNWSITTAISFNSDWKALHHNFSGTLVDGQRYYHCFNVHGFTLNNVRFNASKVSDFGAVNVMGCGQASVENVTILGNTGGDSTTLDGLGMGVFNTTNITMIAVNFSRNRVGLVFGASTVDAARVVNASIQSSFFLDSLGSDGFQLYDSYNITVINSTFYNNTDDGIDLDASDNFTLKYSMIQLNNDRGLEVSATGDSGSGFVFNNTFRSQNISSADAGIELVSNALSWNISYNYFAYNAIGLDDDGSTGNNQNTFVFNNIFFRNGNAPSSGAGVILTSSDRATYRDNVFLSNLFGISISGSTANDNFFFDNQVNQSAVAAFLFSTWSNLNQNFTGNTVDGQRYYHCYNMNEWILSNVRMNASKVSDFGAINIWGCNNVVLTNVTGYGNRAGISPTTDGFGIYLLNSTNITILRSNFSSNNMGGALGATSVDAAAVINATIQDSSFTNNFADDGLRVLSSHNVSIINNTFYNNSQHGLVVDESNNVSVKYSAFSKNGIDGINIDGTSSGSNNGIIFNNTFVGQNGSGDTGITFVSGADNWNISYNHFSYNDFGIQQQGAPNNDNNLFFQNTFLRNSQASSGGGGIHISSNDGNTFRDNVFLYNTIGIRFSTASSNDNHFYDNQINESTLDAFDFSNWDSLDQNFSGNTIDGQRYYHCYNTNTWTLNNVRINASRISDRGGINIWGCSNVALTNVTVYKQLGGASATLEGFGLTVYNTTIITITSSNFSNNKIGAALGESTQSDARVANFTIIDSFFSNNIGTDGLQIYESMNGTIINSSFRNNSDDGLELDNSDNVTIKLSSFIDNSDDGIYIDESGGGIIFNNTFFMQNDSTDDTGIFMDDDNDFWNISFNNFSYNYHGLVIDGQTRNNTGLFFYRNIFWQNRGSGTEGTGVRIQFNNASIFTENYFVDNIQGVEIVDNIYAGRNLFFRNNFKNDSGQVLFHARAPLNITNQFNLSLAPAQGGNFWDNYNDSAEGCNDANNDGFCDSPYLNIGNTSNDSHPYVAEINFDDTAPNTTFLLINSSPLGNLSTSNILCYANISDAQGGTVSANFTWYNNSVEIVHLRGQRSGLGANTVNLIATLNSANLTAGQVWNCSVRGFASTVYEDDWNNISVTILTPSVPDTNPPNVTNTSPFNHQQFNLSQVFFELGANATDGGSPVSNVYANVSYPNGSTLLFELANATTYRTRFNISFVIPELRGYYNVTFIANDSNNNFNNTVQINFSINDNTAPNVTNATPENHKVFNISNALFEIGANVTDDIMVSKVYANVSYPNGSALLFELSNATTYVSRFNTSFVIPELLGAYNITFIANDSSNNRNSSLFVNFSVNDNTAPNVTNITPIQDSSLSTSAVIEIGANVTDDIMVSKVYANVSYPNGSALLFELINGTDYVRRFNLSFTIPSVTGKYNITFIANDSSNNFNRSGRTNFTVAAAASPSSPTGAATQRGGGGGQSRPTVPVPTVECASNLDCPVNRYCVNSKCVRIFDLKILTVDSPVQPGDFFDFSYLVKGIGDISGDVTLDFWLEKGGKKVVTGTDVIFIGKNDQRIESTNLFLPTTLPEGKYTFKIQLTYDRYQIVSSRTVEVKVPAEFLLSAEIPDLLQVAPYLSWTYPLVISINRDEAVKTTINQKILMKQTKGKYAGTYTQIQRKQTSAIVSRLAQLTQSVKGLKPGEYRLEVTVSARKKTVKIVRDFVVVSPLSRLFVQQIIQNIIADAVQGSSRRAISTASAGEVLQLRNLEDLEKLRPVRNITIILENNRTTVMKLFPKIFQGFDDPFYIVTRRTLGYDDSAFETIAGLSYSRESVAGRLLEAEVLNPEQIILQPGEKIEKTILFREGLINPEELRMQFVTEEEVVFEQSIGVTNKLFSGTAVDVDPETDTFEVYTFVVPPAAVELLQEYYEQNSLTGAVIIGDQPQGQQYYLEITMRKKQPQREQGVVERLAQVLKTPRDRFVELYGPYDLTDNQIFVFAQQLSYNQKKYSGEYIVQATVFRGTEKFVTSEYEISFD